MMRTSYFAFLAIGALAFLQSPTPNPALAQRGAAPQALSAERLRELQRSDRDILGEAELARPDDPSFASVAGLLPAMKKSREIVGVKYHPHDIGVAPDGALELSDDVDAAGSPTASFEVGKPAVRFGAAPQGCSKTLLQGFLPIVEAVFEHDGLRYRQTVFGWSANLSPDEPLWGCLEFEAVNPGKTARAAEVGLSIHPNSALNPPRRWSFSLAPGESRKIRVQIPFDILKAKYAEMTAAEFDERLKQTVDFWTADLLRGMTMRLPEKRIDDAVKAWLAYAALDVDKRNGLLEPHDGAGFYESIFGYSAALYPHALDLWGRHDEAARILDSLLAFQRPDGLFTANFGTPDPGALLFALAQHYDLTGDVKWLAGVAPKMLKMADWIIGKRKESMAAGPSPQSKTYGLIKFSPYCDFQEQTYDYFGDAYCAVGLAKTALALAAAGRKEDSLRIGREAAAYRKDLLASMDAAVIDRWGMKVLPMEPETQRLLKSTAYRAGNYYGIIASCMLESEFLPASDRRTGWVTGFMEAKGGLRLGLSEFDGGIDHAYTYGYWLTALKLDQVKRAILGLYGSLAYGMSRDTYAGVEVTHLFTGDNEPTLPHLYSCTQQLRLVRMMLVREEGDDLWIGQAVPRPWLQAGRTVEIRNAPTRFGPVSVVMESRTDEGRIEVELTVPSREAVDRIFLRLRHPEGRKIAAVMIDGKPSRNFFDETITVMNRIGTVRIVVSY
jgi:hypothetical protein